VAGANYIGIGRTCWGPTDAIICCLWSTTIAWNWLPYTPCGILVT